MNEKIHRGLAIIIIVTMIIVSVSIILYTSIKADTNPQKGKVYYLFWTREGKIERCDNGLLSFENNSGFSYNKIVESVEVKKEYAKVWILDEYPNDIRKFLDKRIILKIEYLEENRESGNNG